MSAVILPLGAPHAYCQALLEAWDQYSIGEASPEEQQRFCLGFQKGWESAKNNTFKILDQLNKEDPKDE